MKVKANSVSVGDLFESSSKLMRSSCLEIPRYQRPYSWSESQWGELLADVKGAYKKGLNTDFLGSILLYSKKDNSPKAYEIVDGQQRIITLFILLVSLGFRYNKSDRIPLVISDSLQNEVLVEIATVRNLKLYGPKSRTSIYKAYMFFRDNVKVNKKKLREFILKISLAMVNIDDEFESNLLFGRLNERGLQLSDVNKIKYHIFSKVEADSGRQLTVDAFLKKWTMIQEKLYLIKDSLFIEEFIMICCKIIDPGPSFDIDMFKTKYNNKRKCQAFVTDVNKYASEIHDFKRNVRKNNHIGENLDYFLQFANDSSLIMVLYVLSGGLFDKNQKPPFVKLLTQFEAIRFVFRISDGSSSILDTFDFDEIYSNGSITQTDLLNVISKAVNDKSVKAGFIEKFANLRYTNRDCIDFDTKFEERLTCKYILFSLANDLDGRKKDNSDYTIEHLLPDSHAVDKDAPEIKIGNLLTLEESINGKAKDLPLTEKIVELESSNYNQVKQFLNKRMRTKSHWKYLNLEDSSDKKNDQTWDASEFDKDWVDTRGKALAVEYLNLLDRTIEEMKNL